jgi:hypothetical protein
LILIIRRAWIDYTGAVAKTVAGPSLEVAGESAGTAAANRFFGNIVAFLFKSEASANLASGFTAIFMALRWLLVIPVGGIIIVATYEIFGRHAEPHDSNSMIPPELTILFQLCYPL